MKRHVYINLLNKYNSKYSGKLESLKKYYETNIKKLGVDEITIINDEYRNIVKKIIIDVLNDLKSEYDGEFIVALSGSLARKTNTLYSDIDINYLCNKKDYNDIILFEDKVNYILQNVLKFRGKDKIHSMAVYLPLVSNIKFDFIKKINIQLFLMMGNYIHFVERIKKNLCLKFIILLVI